MYLHINDYILSIIKKWENINFSCSKINIVVLLYTLKLYDENYPSQDIYKNSLFMCMKKIFSVT